MVCETVKQDLHCNANFTFTMILNALRIGHESQPSNLVRQCLSQKEKLVNSHRSTVLYTEKNSIETYILTACSESAFDTIALTERAHWHINITYCVG